MNFEEHAGKDLLQSAGINTLQRRLVTTPDAAADAAEALGAVVVKAQVPTGKRGKAGGIKAADNPEQARAAAAAILGMQIGGHPVEKVLIEQQARIAQEYYAAILNDPLSKGPLLMFSAAGGMDIEEIAAGHPDQLRQFGIDIRQGLSQQQAHALLHGLALDGAADAIADTLVKLYQVYRDNDAELLEINPLARLADGSVVALDCKFVLDDSAVKRRETLSGQGTPDPATDLELRAQQLALKYIQLDGNIGVLANGAGLTMTTMDVIVHHGGRPANFLEIGGESYTKATPALKLVLDNPGVQALVVNFCGAFARTDVMTEGVINALQELQPDLPVFFSVHGTGAAEARQMLKQRLDIVPYDTMDDAIVAAIQASGGTSS
jgi:succinyl-CoA synthetase beta subunit